MVNILLYTTKTVCIYYIGLQMRPNKENKYQDEVRIIYSLRKSWFT